MLTRPDYLSCLTASRQQLERSVALLAAQLRNPQMLALDDAGVTEAQRRLLETLQLVERAHERLAVRTALEFVSVSHGDGDPDESERLHPTVVWVEPTKAPSP